MRHENIPLRYPVVLVHGILAHDRASLIKFWGRIPQILTGCGIKVYWGNTDAWGEYESNALILKRTIEKILSENKTDKVNILAHSKGGIDSRYLVWKHNFGDKIASLTTICTPHHGSEIADLIFNKEIIHKDLTKKALSIFGKLCGDTNPNLYNVNYQLTTANMKEFNKKIPMDNRVFYQSLYTTMNNALDEKMLSFSYSYINNISGKNDGLVSEYSAKWGENIGKIEGGISHVGILDVNSKKIPGVNIPDIYVKIAKELSNKGF